MDVIAALLIAVVLWLVVLSAGLAFCLWLLGRHNRIRADRPTLAPLTWVWSPSRGARLHRRLRAAAGWVDGDPDSAHDHLRTMLVDQAVELDRYVVTAGRAPRSHRRPMLADASRRVAELERLSVRVHALTDPTAGNRITRYGPTPAVAENLERLREHLDLLEEANSELAALEDLPDLDVSGRPSRTRSPEGARHVEPRHVEATPAGTEATEVAAVEENRSRQRPRPQTG